MNKEQIYDERINPLMAQIIALCQEHKIAMLAHFAIPTDDDIGLCCTTHLPDESGDLPSHIEQAVRIIRPRPVMLTTRDAAGDIVSMVVVLP